MTAPVFLDGFCGRGGMTAGFLRAGFECVGFDIDPQPDYPGEFVMADICDLDGADFWRAEVVHMSPVCEGYTRLRHLNPKLRDTYPKPRHVELTLEAVRFIRQVWESRVERGLAPPLWSVENVDGALPWFQAVLGEEPAKRAHPFYLWGRFPDFELPPGPTKIKMGAMGISQSGRPRVKVRIESGISAEIPPVIADGYARACMAVLRPEVIT